MRSDSRVATDLPDARDDPTQHVGIRRLVGERLAHPASGLGLQRAQVGRRPHHLRTRLRQWIAGLGVLPDFRFRIGVVLAGTQAGGHVHHVADARIRERRPRELRHVACHGRRRVDHALGGQHRGEGTGQRLGYRHRGMAAVLAQLAGIELVHHTTAMQHHQTVGVVGRQRCLPCHWRACPGGREADRIDRAVQRHRQRHRCTQPARHLHRGQELPHVHHAPAQRGKAEERPIGRAQALVGRRRKALHPAQGAGVGCLGIGRSVRRGRIGCA